MLVFNSVIFCFFNAALSIPLYSGDGSVEDEKFVSDTYQTPTNREEMGKSNVDMHDDLLLDEILESSPSTVSVFNATDVVANYSDVTGVISSANETAEIKPPTLLFPTYDDDAEDNPLFSLQFDYSDYNQNEIPRLIFRRRFNEEVPPPLQNLPHDIPPDRTVAEVLAENTIKDIQYDEHRIKELVHELLSHTSLHDFGEVYSDDSQDNDVPTVLST